MAVWNQFYGSHFTVMASEYKANSGWGTPTPLATTDSDSFYPKVKYDQYGNAVAVWYEDGRLGVAHHNSSGWQTAYYLSNKSYSFDLSSLPNGRFLLVMTEWNGQAHVVSSSTYSPNGGWSEPRLIQSDAALESLNVTVAVGTDGKGVAVWEQYDRDIYAEGAIKYIWASRYDPGTGWAAPSRIESQSGGHASLPKVAIDGKGNAYVVWIQMSGPASVKGLSRSNVWFNIYRAGLGWDTERLLSDTNPGDAYLPAVASNAKGQVMVVWRQSETWRRDVVTLWFKRLDQSGWSSAGKVSEDLSWGDSDNFQGHFPAALVVDSLGNALVVWDFYNIATGRDIASSRYAPGKGWDKAEFLDDIYGSDFSPKAAIDDSGQATVMWCNASGPYDELKVTIWEDRLR